MALKRMLTPAQSNPRPGVIAGTPSYYGKDRAASGSVQTPFRNKLIRKTRPGF